MKSLINWGKKLISNSSSNETENSEIKEVTKVAPTVDNDLIVALKQKMENHLQDREMHNHSRKNASMQNIRARQKELNKTSPYRDPRLWVDVDHQETFKRFGYSIFQCKPSSRTKLVARCALSGEQHEVTLFALKRNLLILTKGRYVSRGACNRGSFRKMDVPPASLTIDPLINELAQAAQPFLLQKLKLSKKLLAVTSEPSPETRQFDTHFSAKAIKEERQTLRNELRAVKEQFQADWLELRTERDQYQRKFPKDVDYYVMVYVPKRDELKALNYRKRQDLQEQIDKLTGQIIELRKFGFIRETSSAQNKAS